MHMNQIMKPAYKISGLQLIFSQKTKWQHFTFSTGLETNDYKMGWLRKKLYKDLTTAAGSGANLTPVH